MANSGLAALLAKKKAAENGPEVSESLADNTQAHDGASNGAPESASVSPEAPATAGETQRNPNPFARRKDSGQDDSTRPVGTGPIAGSGNDSGGEQPKSRLSSLSLGAGASDSSSNPGVVATPVVDSLESLDQSEDAGIAPRESVSHFTDETPAQKPTRELPEGLTKEQLGFVDMIDGVYEVIHEPDLMGGVIRNIIIELKSNPEYMKLVAPDDIRTWVRGMRDSMGLTKIKKTESKARKSGGAGKKSKLVDDDMLQDLNDLGVDIPV